MKALLRTTAVISILAVVGTLIYGWWMTRPLFDERLDADPFSTVTIAPLADAITLARSWDGTVLLVTDSNATGVIAIDIAEAAGIERFADAVAAYNVLGARRLMELAGHPATEFVTWDELDVPVNFHFPHIAAGTNFRSHAEEVGHDGDPFLFPKLSDATPWNAVVRSAVRLDHEVELCAVPFSDARAHEPVTLGYLLCGDFTDRWQLVASIDLDGPMGQSGFPEGKGGATRMPVGALLVVPHDDKFFAGFDLNLYVNGRLRQRAEAGLMIWTPRQIIDQALDACETAYQLGKATLQLTPCQHVPARTILLTGTPEGVMFHLASLINPWAYLRAGDEVVSTSRHLGVLRNIVQ